MTITQTQKDYYTNVMGAKRFAEEFALDDLTQQAKLDKTAWEMHPPDVEDIIADLNSIKIWVELKSYGVVGVERWAAEVYCNFETSGIMFANEEIVDYFFEHIKGYTDAYKQSALDYPDKMAGLYRMIIPACQFVRWCAMSGYIALPMLKSEYIEWDSPLEYEFHWTRPCNHGRLIAGTAGIGPGQIVNAET